MRNFFIILLHSLSLIAMYIFFIPFCLLGAIGTLLIIAIIAVVVLTGLPSLLFYICVYNLSKLKLK
jgi:hypothetical protein